MYFIIKMGNSDERIQLSGYSITFPQILWPTLYFGENGWSSVGPCRDSRPAGPGEVGLSLVFSLWLDDGVQWWQCPSRYHGPGWATTTTITTITMPSIYVTFTSPTPPDQGTRKAGPGPVHVHHHRHPSSDRIPIFIFQNNFTWPIVLK